MTLYDADKLDRARLLIETLGLISQVGDAEDLEIADLMILGDSVFIPPITQGTVLKIEDHPLEYAQLLIEIQGAAGPVKILESARMARKILRPWEPNQETKQS